MLAAGGFVFIQHALDEMQADQIAVEEALAVLTDYDDEYVQEWIGRAARRRTMDDGRMLVVILDVDGVTVVSAWWDKRSSARRRR